MRWKRYLLAAVMVGGAWLSGCSSAPQTASRQAPPPVAQLDRSADGQAPAPGAEADGQAIAAALVFPPALAADTPALDLSRDARGPSAFLGFQDLTVTHFFLWMDDRQLNYGPDNHDRFERQAITQKSGVTYR